MLAEGQATGYPVEDPWTYLRRYAVQPDDAERRVETDFPQWVAGRLEGEGSGG